VRTAFAVTETSAAAAAAAASSSLAAGTARRVLLQRRHGRQRHEPSRSRRRDEVPRRLSRVTTRRRTGAALVETRRDRVKVRWSPVEIQRRNVVLLGRSRDGRGRLRSSSGGREMLRGGFVVVVGRGKVFVEARLLLMLRWGRRRGRDGRTTRGGNGGGTLAHDCHPRRRRDALVGNVALAHPGHHERLTSATRSDGRLRKLLFDRRTERRRSSRADGIVERSGTVARWRCSHPSSRGVWVRLMRTG
jgi:hypothetical protein